MFAQTTFIGGIPNIIALNYQITIENRFA